MQSSSKYHSNNKFPLRDVTASYNQNIPSSTDGGYRRAAPTPTFSSTSTASYYSAKINNDERIANELAPITHLLRRISNSCGKHAEWQQRKAEHLRCSTHMLRSVRQRLLEGYLTSGGNNIDSTSITPSTLRSAAALVIPRVDLPVVVSTPTDPSPSSHTLPITAVLPLIPAWCSSLLPHNNNQPQQQPRISYNSNAEETSEDSDVGITNGDGKMANGNGQRHALSCLIYALITYGSDLPPHSVELLTTTVSRLTASSSSNNPSPTTTTIADVDDQDPLMETLVARVALLTQPQ